LSNNENLYRPVQGKTYSLFAEGDDSEHYYAEIKRLADGFLQRCPDEKRLLSLIQKAGKKPFLMNLKTTGDDQKTLQFLRETLRESLLIYTHKSCSLLATYDMLFSERRKACANPRSCRKAL